MRKTVLVLSTSPRKNGNSAALAEQFAKGAESADHAVETVSLHDKTIGFCRGCLTCQETKKCIIPDDMDAIIEKMLHADVIAFATPIYFYEMSGQMKTLLDRTNPLFPQNSRFRDIYLLASAAEPEESTVDGAVSGLNGWIACFEQVKLRGVVRGVGVTNPGDMGKLPRALNAAYELGKAV